jgi:hypothetical protein
MPPSPAVPFTAQLVAFATDLRDCLKTPRPQAGDGERCWLFFNRLARQRLSKNASKVDPIVKTEMIGV